MKKFILIFFIFFTSINSENYNHKNQLDKLFSQLATVNNLKTAKILEEKIWLIWNKHPNNLKLTEKLEFGTELMQYGDYNYALKVFDNVVRTDPELSEAWNKRATLLFLMKEY